MIVMTNLILLIGAGLFSRSVGSFERHAFNHLLGAEVDDAGGDGPGSYPVAGNIWHLDCCNPENNLDTQGWSVFNAIFGWSNNGSSKSHLPQIVRDNLIEVLRRSWYHPCVRILLDRRYRHPHCYEIH
jgi:high-affinity iron transporter